MKYAMSYAWAKMGVLADVVNVTVLATSIVLQASFYVQIWPSLEVHLLHSLLLQLKTTADMPVAASKHDQTAV